MKYLLDNQYAPTTFSWGFIHAPFPQTTKTFLSWSDSVFKQFDLEYDVLHCHGSLPELLEKLFPVSSPSNREILMATHSAWTAYFDNGSNQGDPFSRVGHLCQEMKCRGAAVTCAPHRHPEEDTGVYGAVQFQLFAPHETHFLNYERGVSVAHDGDQWVFDATGSVQPFEETLEYDAHRVRDRFTPEMLERYCRALGIDLFNPDFYGPNAVLVINKGPFGCEPKRLSHHDALKKLGLDRQ